MGSGTEGTFVCDDEACDAVCMGTLIADGKTMLPVREPQDPHP